MAEQQDLVNLTIDGRPVRAPKGAVIWAAAQQLDIEVPIYCYHPRMDPLGACRMCFVEVQGMPKLATACTTTVSEGMVVRTDTPKVKKGRQGTLEFLLINHPLDCPICDKGGECDLQDFTLRHGPGDSRFDVRKRHFPKPIPVSENILLDRERCIACQRCVRFCQDVAMEDGLVMKERGFKTEVGVEEDAPFDSIFSGNVVEMCPVGALTAKNYRFVTRPWELRRTATVCGNCAVGCNVRLDVRVNKAQRQYSRPNDAVDDGWLCDRGRWELDALNSPERLTTPLLRKNGELVPVSWDEALGVVASTLRQVISTHGAHGLGGIGSTHTTNEESYLFQKLLRSLGTNTVDHYHGIFPQAGADGAPWVWTGSLAGLERASHIVLLGGDPYHRQPVLDLRIRKAIRKGARVYVVTSEPNRLDRLATGAIRYTGGQTGAMARALLGLTLAEGLTHGDYVASHAEELAQWQEVNGSAEDAAKSAGVEIEALRTLAREIAGASGAMLLYDEMATREPTGATLAADALLLAQVADNIGRLGAGVGPLFEDNNSLGARDMGLLPDTLPGYQLVADEAARSAVGAAWGAQLSSEPGCDYDAMFSGSVRALFVLGANPARHATPEQLARIEKLDALIVQDLFLTETAQRAMVVLPGLSYGEKDGTFTNLDRRIQVVRKGMTELPGARADWEILTTLARMMGLSWAYLSPNDILREIGRVAPIYAGVTRRALGESGLQWPLRPGEAGADGRKTIVGSETLTWPPAGEKDAAETSPVAVSRGEE
ncbi:MAG TPA: NADH-quinone oxidoreductase subunit NuoG [Ktedonobacterales bacterium]|jgi:NADH-quinone oxidoreductase chain G